MQDPDGDVGNLRRAPPHVRGSQNAQARLQSNPQKQEDNCSEPGSPRNPGNLGFNFKP